MGNMFKPSSVFTDHSKAVRASVVDHFLLFMFHACLSYGVLSVPCSLVITCWERANLLALLCVVFSCVFVTFPYRVPDQLWYLIVSIPDLCLPLFLSESSLVAKGHVL